MKKYKAVLKATKGVLLGGVKVHESGWYDTEEKAQHLLEVYVRGNNGAKRHHDDGKVVSKWSKKALEKKGYVY